MKAKRLYLGNVPLASVIVIGIVLSALAYFAIQRHYQDQADAEFSGRATGYANLIVDGFAQAIFAIESVGAYYSATQSVMPAQFEKFVSPMLERFPTIKALGWVPRITGANRAAFEQVAQTSSSDFRITEVGQNGDLVTAAERPVYFPVHLIRPLAENEAAVGFDIYSNPIRRAAIDAAISSGRTTSTARIRLVQETGEQFSVLIINPVFGRQDPETGGRRVRGVASAVYRIGDGVEMALAQMGPVRVNVWLYDRSADVESQFMYFHGASVQADGQWSPVPEPPSSGPRYVHDFQLAGRSYRLVMTPGEGRPGVGGRHLALAAFGIGLLFTGLMAAYIGLTLRRSKELLDGQKALEHEIGERERAEL